MATTTRKGDELALKLAPVIGTTRDIRATCALLCRHAATLHRLAEDDCNGHPANGNPTIPAATVSKLQAQWEARVERGQDAARRRMHELVGRLPDRWRLEAESDPRGCSVIVYCGDDEFRGDSWGDSRGVCIP